jgi:hypothetical protein
VHVAVVGNGQGRHLQAGGLGHQFVYPAGAVQEAVLGMEVEMDEIGRIHGRMIVGNQFSKKTFRVFAAYFREKIQGEGSGEEAGAARPAIRCLISASWPMPHAPSHI